MQVNLLNFDVSTADCVASLVCVLLGVVVTCKVLVCRTMLCNMPCEVKACEHSVRISKELPDQIQFDGQATHAGKAIVIVSSM